MDDLADELFNAIVRIQDELAQYTSKKQEQERRLETERVEQNERLNNVENEIINIRDKVAALQSKQRISVSIQTESIVDLNEMAESMPTSSNVNISTNTPSLVTSPVIKLTNLVQINQEVTVDTSKKTIEKSSLEKLLDGESLSDSNSNPIFEMNTHQSPLPRIDDQKVEEVETSLPHGSQEAMSSDEIEEEFDADELARQALLNAINQNVSEMSYDEDENENDDNSVIGLKPFKINLKNINGENFSSSQNYSLLTQSSQKDAPTTSKKADTVKVLEEPITIASRCIHDLQQDQIKLGCHVVIEPLDLSKYKRLSSKTFQIKKIKKQLNNDDSDDDEDGYKGIDRLMNAAYQTRSIKKQLREISESGESDSFYDKDRNAHKRAFIKKFIQTESDDQNEDEDDYNGDVTLKDFENDLLRDTNFSDPNDDKIKNILLNTIDSNGYLLNEDEFSSFDDDSEESSGPKTSKKKTKAMKKAEKEAQLKKQIEDDLEDETEYIKKLNGLKLPKFGSSSSSNSEDDDDDSDKTVVNNKYNKPPKRREQRISTDIESYKTSTDNLVSNSNSDDGNDEEEDDEEIIIKEKEDNDDEDRIESPKKRNKRTRIDSSSSSSSLASSSPISINQRQKRTRSKMNANKEVSDSDSDIIEITEDHNTSRQKLRPIIDDRMLALETQKAQVEEKERIKRIEEKRKLESRIITATNSPVKQRHLLYLDIDEAGKPIIQVDEKIVEHLKDHQKEGVKFMWDSSFEKVQLIKDNHKGGGCILAHCMGLGKTLTTITLVHTVMANADLTKVKRVLIVMPVNVLNNWKDEIGKWTKNCSFSTQDKVFEINDKQNNKLSGTKKIEDRLFVLKEWFDKGGILLMGYSIFTRLITGKNSKIAPTQLEEFKTYLTNPGPDLIVCDEGHQLKNLKSEVNKAVSQMKTRRRIVLTGTPLQNNLGELYTMVSFIKPNLLGTLKEFRNRFENPIQNGQHRNSTEYDVRQMKRRSHVLFNTLDPFVNRKDYSFFKDSLQPKMEYVLCIRLSPKQIEYYKSFLTKNGLDQLNSKTTLQSVRILTDFHTLFRIWTHPWAIRLKEEENQKKANCKIRDKNLLMTNEEQKMNDNCDAINERIEAKPNSNNNSSNEMEEGEIMDELGQDFHKTSIDNM